MSPDRASAGLPLMSHSGAPWLIKGLVLGLGYERAVGGWVGGLYRGYIGIMENNLEATIV